MADAPAIPFRKATVRKRSLEATYAVPSSLNAKNIWQLDSKGYIGGVRLLVSGTATTAVGDPGASADFPFNLIKRTEIRDSSGGMLQNLKGYSAHLAKWFFSPVFGNNLATAADTRIYAATISIVGTNNINFGLTYDIEAGTKDNLGLVPNQNAAFVYTLDVTIDTTANVVTTPTSLSSTALTLQPSYRYYTVPAPVRADGVAQESVPPFAGVVRQVYDENRNVANTVETRYNLVPGKVIRNLLFVLRNASNVRIAALSRIKCFYGDDTLLFDATEQDVIEESYRLWGNTPPVGVYPVSFTADSDLFNGADYRRDIVDTRRLSQIYFAITATATGNMDIIHDELIVPRGMSL